MINDIRIITDSASDIPDEYLALVPEVVMLNIPMVVDGQPKRERRDFSTEEYYDILERAAELPTTSQVTMMEYQEEYAKAFADGIRHPDVQEINVGLALQIAHKPIHLIGACPVAREADLREVGGVLEQPSLSLHQRRGCLGALI